MNTLHRLILSALLFASFDALATIPIIKFEEGGRYEFSLSSLNFNRIHVEGERIVTVSFPERSFIVEQNSQEVDDEDDAVVLKPLAHIPLTVYFTTNLNHHFSATITPSEDLGQTIQFVSKKLKGFDYAKDKEQKEYQISDVMTALMEGAVPSGYQEVAVKGGSFYLHKNLKLTLLKQYKGSESSGYVYRIENQSKENIELTPSLFEKTTLQSMELSQKVLMPRQSAYFYGIYKEPSNIG